jgi:hypothetical protein
MPRTGRGGNRSGTGTVGRQYANRTDIAAPPPNQAAPGQEYGTAGAQQESMRQLPVSAPPDVGAAMAGPQAGGVGLTSATQPPAPVPPQQGMNPGEIPWTQTPTQRPTEPITAGLATGPGAGPEALTNGWGTGTSAASESVGHLIAALASQPGASSTLRGLAQLAAANKAG